MLHNFLFYFNFFVVVEKDKVSSKVNGAADVSYRKCRCAVGILHHILSLALFVSRIL